MPLFTPLQLVRSLHHAIFTTSGISDIGIQQFSIVQQMLQHGKVLENHFWR